MDDFVRRVYLYEVATQCQFALNAVKVLNTLLSQPNEVEHEHELTSQPNSNQEIFRTLHSLLTHASNVSKLLWPAPSQGESKGKFKSPRSIRAEELRKFLGLPENNHPLKSRSIRNHLEHFDERLDQWQKNSVRKNFIQDNIGPLGSIGDFDEGDIMRWYDPATKQMIFCGESFDIQQIVSGICDTLERCKHVTVN